MPNLQRSVERVKGVVSFQFDLDNGRAAVGFEKASPVERSLLWQAVIDAGFTPDRIESKGEVYSGPKPDGG